MDLGFTAKGLRPPLPAGPEAEAPERSTRTFSVRQRRLEDIPAGQKISDILERENVEYTCVGIDLFDIKAVLIREHTEIKTSRIEKLVPDRVVFESKAVSSVVEDLSDLSQEQLSLVSEFVAALKRQSSPASPAQDAIPEYPDRHEKDRYLNVVDYIQAYWKDRLDGTFTRADLSRGWPRTKKALERFERDHGGRQLADVLPSIGEFHQRQIEQGAIEKLRAKPILTLDERKLLQTLVEFRARRCRHLALQAAE